MKGLCGFGRYEDSPDHIGCPYAKSDMTPCVARDGACALAINKNTTDSKCVGCGQDPVEMLVDIVKEISKIESKDKIGGE